MGRDKATLLLHGRPLLAWVAAACREVTSRVLVVAAAGQELDTLPEGARLVRDHVEGEGPIAGIIAGLTAIKADTGAEGSSTAGDAVLLVACDQPFIRPALLRLLLAHLDDHAVVVPMLDGRAQPLCAAISRRALPLLRAAFEDGVRAASVLTDLPGAMLLPETEWRPADADARSFFGVNTPEAAARAEGFAQALDPPPDGGA